MTWIGDHREDVIFVVSLLASLALLTVGLLTGDEATILLGAGALGIPSQRAMVRSASA